jgi:Carboxypeptidase regulatory-like domain
MKQTRFSFLVLPLILVLACATAFAQANSELTGIVTDQTGAVVAGAKIVLSDPATGLNHTTFSGSTGLYDVPGLNPAIYNLKITAKGFETYLQNGIVINTSATARMDVKLTVGAEATTVTVQADALSVQADSNVISTLITSEDISELATENRNFSSLAALGLGVTNSMPDSNSVTAVNANWAISFNGLNQTHNDWMVDGGESYDRGSGGKSAIMPSQDAIAEFQVLSSNYPPDYGIATGGTVSMTLKSGAKKFHGTLYEENRNTDYDANSYFNKMNTPISPRVATHYNIYGGNFSGPVFIPHTYNSEKQKTFFFWNEEWRKTTSPSSAFNPTIDPADIPTLGTDLAYVTPKFASSPIQLIVPKTIADPALLAKLTALGLAPGDNFPGNVIPHQLFDSNGVLYLNSGILPKPTNNDDQAASSTPLPTNARDDIVRIDHNFNEKWTLMGHWIGDYLNTSGAGPILGWCWCSYPTITSAMQNPANSAVIKVTGTINPNLLVEASMNYDGNVINIHGSAIGQKPSGWSVQPVTAAFPLTQRTAMPGIQGFGNPYGTAEDTNTDPYHNAARDYQPKLDVSYTSGKHAMKYGFSYMRYTKNQIIGGDSQGNYGFGTLTNDGLMDMLIGLPTSYNQEQSTPIRHWYNQTPSVYAMDNWHVSPRLSLQIGLRYDALPHAVERQNYMANFDPSQYLQSAAPVWNGQTIANSSPGVVTLNSVPFYLNGEVLAGQNKTPRGLVKNDFNTIQPRVGFSEDLFGNGKTVLRGGFGMFFERMQGNDVYDLDGDQPWAANLSVSNTYFSTPGTSWLDGSSINPNSLPVFANGLTSIATTYKAPNSAEFSFGIQDELAPSVIWVAQYVGNLDYHQDIQFGSNTDPVNSSISNKQIIGNGNCKSIYLNGSQVADPNCTVTSVPNGNIYRIYQGYGGITEEANIATGSYNSLQTGLRVQNKWGLSGEVDYTFAHQIDSTENSTDLTTIDNPFNFKYDKGSGALDRRSMLSINYVYKMPFFAKAQGLVHTIAGGWELAGTVVDESGVPTITSVNLNYDPIGLNGGYNERPNVTGKMTYPKTFKQWFDTSRLSAPVPVWDGGGNLGWGNAGKDAIVGPGRVNFTTSLYKSFAIREAMNFQLRFESFNTFNHTEYSGVNTALYGSAYGQINGTWDPRALQLAGRFTF